MNPVFPKLPIMPVSHGQGKHKPEARTTHGLTALDLAATLLNSGTCQGNCGQFHSRKVYLV